MAAEIEDNQGQLKISPSKREVGWLLDLYALVETFPCTFTEALIVL